MTAKHGATDWKEPAGGGGKQGGKDFLRLKPGSNIVRIVTVPYIYSQHRYEPEGGKKYGYRINCSRSESEKRCPLCEQGNKAKQRWFVGVLEKDSGAYKTLDIGYSVFKSLLALAKGTWGTPDKYDVDIIVDPQGGPQGYYYVQPQPSGELTAQQIAAKEDGLALNDLEARCEPPTPQKVQERLDKIQEEIDNGGQDMSGARTSGRTQAADKTTSAASSDDEEEDDFFKNYQKKTA